MGATDICRIVFRALIDDVQGSIAFIRSVCFHSTEINFTLPASRDLWEAKTPQQWKALCLSKQKLLETTSLTFLDVIRDPCTLELCGDVYDCELAALAALHSLWSQEASFLDAKILYQGPRQPLKVGAGPSWLEVQRQDIYRKLSYMQEALRSIGILTAEAHIVSELFMMSLYISHIDIQKFAGRYGVKVSQVILPSIQTWFASDEPRYATWHAGQILRAAQSMRPTQIQGFYAFAVYQACLTLALPFLLSSYCFPSPGASPRPSPAMDVNLNSETPDRVLSATAYQLADAVVVNGKPSIQTKMYLTTGQGSPALLVGEKVELISDVDIVSNVMVETFRNNHSSAVNTLPPFAEKLVELVKDLTRGSHRLG